MGDKLFSDGEEYGTRLAELEHENREFVQGVDRTCRELKQGQNELESLLDSERELRKGQIDSESKSRACDLEKFSLELSRKHSETLKLCRRSNERCTQLEELASNCNGRCTQLEESVGRLDAIAELVSNCNERCTQLSESVGRVDAMTAELASNCSPETMHEQFESLLALERTTLRKFVSTEGAALAESLNIRVTEALSYESSNRQKNLGEVKDRFVADHTELNNLISQQHDVHIQACHQIESESKNWAEGCNTKIKMNESLIADACGNFQRLDQYVHEKFSAVEERIGTGAAHANAVHDEINTQLLKLWQKVEQRSK